MGDAYREFWIIGYGNHHRRDDGIGPYTIGRLDSFLKRISWVRTAATLILDPLLALQMEKAGSVIFIDASAGRLKNSHCWFEISPERDDGPGLTHHLGPVLFLNTLSACFRRCPAAWLIAIQGFDFGMGDGLTPQARAAVEEALPTIVALVTQKHHRGFVKNPVPIN